MSWNTTQQLIKMNASVKKRKAQSFLEYAMCIALVITALAVMFFFFRDHSASRVRTSVDTIGLGEQYQP